jgi:hypothetical protein
MRRGRSPNEAAIEKQEEVPPKRAQVARSMAGDGSSPDPATPDAARAEKGAKRRAYRMTDKAMAQRRTAAEKSTGPKTAAGKAQSSRNSLAHGMTAFKVSYLVAGEDGPRVRRAVPGAASAPPPAQSHGRVGVAAIGQRLVATGPPD